MKNNKFKSSRGSKERSRRFGEDTKEKPRRFGEDTKERSRRFGEDTKERPRRVSEEIIKNPKVIKEDVIEKPIREDIIEGRNAVIEALKGERTIEQIYVAKGDTGGSITVVLALAKEKKIVVKEVDRRKLDQMSETGVHQGVMAQITPYVYSEIEDILKYAESKDENPFIIILDEIEDPHNFGSIVRTAEICGAHGVIIPKRRNVGVTPTVYKAAAGAVEHVKIAKVTNINSVIEVLKSKGIWVYGADMTGKNYCFDTDFSGPAAIIIGSEGKGISKLTKEKCDVLVKIPMVGRISSFNASVAGGILMYEILKQRIKIK